MMRWYGDQVMRDIKRDGAKAVAKAAFLLKSDIQRSFTRTGYAKGKRGGMLHAGPGVRLRVPSRPGQPPAVQIGNLRRSITVDVGRDFDGNVARVGPGREAPYGKFLEFGTRKIKPRPFLRPALARNLRVITELLTRR